MNWKKICIIIISIIILSLIAGTITLYFTVKPTIKIKGEKEIILNLKEEYKEKGAKASLFGKDLSKNIKTEGIIDIEKVGTYTITYKISSKYFKKSAKAIRTIKVVDNINPEIKLKGGNVSLYVGEKYNEPGYTASDNYDGDITKNVVISNNIDASKEGKYEVIYYVSDSSGNKAEIKRTVEVKKKPVVTYSYNSGGGGDGLPVLMYHFFYDASKGQTGNDNNWMEISDFENQMKYLSDNGYYFPSWDEVADYVDGKKSLPQKSVVITVDDGHPSFFDLAVPIINKYNVKATSFVVTSWTSYSTMRTHRNEKIQFQTHTHDMHQGGCSGGHGGLFRCISYDKGLADLNKSTAIVESKSAIAYPFGDLTDNVLKITKDAGIKLGFTTEYGQVYKGMNKLKLPRVRINRGTPLNSFINAIS